LNESKYMPEIVEYSASRDTIESIISITTFFSRASFHGKIVYEFSCKITILPSLKCDYLLNLQDLNKVEVSIILGVVTNLIGYLKSIFTQV